MVYLISFAYFAIGGICIFFLQKFPFQKLWLIGTWFQKGGFLHELFECDLCLGVWTYWILAFFFKMNFLQGVFYVPVLSELITGGVASFLVHLLKIGFEAKFSVIEVR